MDSMELHAYHKHCFKNKDELMRSKKCACFFCKNTYKSSEIPVNSYIKEKDGAYTAVCPKCGIDSVIGDASGLVLSEEFIQEMHKYFF